ncbi:hypothetical protein DF185_07875 [Marinifilum breve]|uniref:Uncharacterized protein n=1 Tax=Marinifilum breve TaxID=2184082 RepID=A0A2V3ZYP2_9BACT|nr:hypothetical protein [Marinifilum breve]PXY01393.1 hypothetical protein DF185_07875 [Marinifilum breve]
MSSIKTYSIKTFFRDEKTQPNDTFVSPYTSSSGSSNTSNDYKYAKLEFENTFRERTTFNNDVIVNANIIQNGSIYETNVEQIKIKNSLNIINDGEVGSGVSSGFAGWRVDRGTATDFDFGFDEVRKRFVVGKTDGNREVVATIQDNPTDGSALVYDGSNHYLKSVSAVPNSLKLGGVIASNYARTDIAETFDNSITVNGQVNLHSKIHLGGDESSNYAQIHRGSISPIKGIQPYTTSGRNSNYLWFTNGYSADEGGLYIGDDGVVVFGAADSNLFSVWNEDAGQLEFRVKNDKSGNYFRTGLTIASGGLNVSGKSIISTSGEALVLKGTVDKSSNSFSSYLRWEDSNNNDLGYVGYGSSSDNSLSLCNDIGDIYLRRNTTNVVKVSLDGVSITGNHNISERLTTKTSYFTHNQAHYFRDPNAESWRGGLFWDTSGHETFGFLARNSGTRIRFYNADIANVASGNLTNNTVGTPYFDIGSSSILVKPFIGSTSYVSGFLGTGWRIESSGAATMDSIELRKFLRTPELIKNQVQVEKNEFWFTDSETIESVTLSGSEYVLTFNIKEGDGLSFRVNDIVRGVFNHSTGFESGFYQITYTNESGDAKVKVLNGTTPKPYMRLARQGNLSNTARQGSLYADGLNGYLRVLNGVNSENISLSNIRIQLGNLSGITDSSFNNITGYGLYADNAYLKGGIDAKFGKIAGWYISTNTLFSPTVNNGRIELATDGNVPRVQVYRDNDNLVRMYQSASGWGLIGNSGGSTVFQLGSLNQISGWTFTNTTLYKGDSSGYLTLDSSRLNLKFRKGTQWGYVGQTWDVSTSSYTGDYGISFGDEGSNKKEYFRIDSSVKRIAGWTFTENQFTKKGAGVWKDNGYVGHITMSLENTGSGSFYNGSQKLKGFSVATNQSGLAQTVVMGQMMNSGSSIRAGYFGLQMMSSSGHEYFALGANTNITSGVYCRIGGWIFDDRYLRKGNLYLDSQNNSIYCQSGDYSNREWSLENNGSGRLAKGNITWDASGNLIIKGNITGSTGNIGGFKIHSTKLTSVTHNLHIDTQSGVYLLSGIGQGGSIGFGQKTDDLGSFYSTGFIRSYYSGSTNKGIEIEANNGYNIKVSAGNDFIVDSDNTQINSATKVIGKLTVDNDVEVIGNIDVKKKLSLNHGHYSGNTSSTTTIDTNLYSLFTLGSSGAGRRHYTLKDGTKNGQICILVNVNDNEEYFIKNILDGGESNWWGLGGGCTVSLVWINRSLYNGSHSNGWIVTSSANNNW